MASKRGVPRKMDLASGPNYKWWVFTTIALGTFISAMDQGSVSIALPRIESHFRTDLPTVQWVVVAYALTISVLLLPMGRLGDTLNRKTVYLAGMGLFMAGAALAALASTITLVIAGKALQGVGSAMLQGNAMATALSVFPASERGKVLGLHVSVVGVGIIVGPALGGVIINSFGWRAAFLANVPLGAMALLSSAAILDRRRLAAAEGGGGRRFDYAGAALCGAALLLFLLVMSYGQRTGWTSPAIVLGAGGCALAAGLFIRWELRTPMPMLDVRMFSRRVVGLGVAAAWMHFLASSSVIFLMPFFLQKVQGLSPREAGLVMVPGAATLTVVGPMAGRLSDRLGWRRLTMAGLLCSATAQLLLATRLAPGSSLGFVIPVLVLNSCGMGLFTSPNTNSIMSGVERAKYGVVTALTQLVRNSGSVTSIAIATTIVTATMAARGLEPRLDAVVGEAGPAGVQAFVTGMHRAYLAGGGVLAVALLLTFLKGDNVRSTREAAVAGAPSGQGQEAEALPALPTGPVGGRDGVS